MNVLEWTFRLKDQVSAGAKSAAGSVGEFVQTLHSGLAVAEYAVRAGQMIGGALAAAVQPAVTREKTLGAFTTMLHDATAATELYAEAVQFANQTPFETKDVVSSYKQLLAAQFKKEDLQTVVRIVGDAASLQEFPQQAMESVNRALGQIKSKGKLSQEELNQVAEAVPLNQGMFLENLSKLYGMNINQVRQLKEQGKIDADAGVFAVLQTLKQQFGGNMETASKQVEGLWSTIKSIPSTYLEKLQDTKGYEALRKGLAGVVAVLDPMSERGKVVQQFVNDMGSGILERIGVLFEYVSEGAGAFFDGLSVGLGPLNTAFGPTNQDNLEKFRATMEGVGNFAGKTAHAFGLVADAVEDAWNYFTKIGEWWSQNKTVTDWLDKWVSPLFNEAPTTGNTNATTQAQLTAQSRLRARASGGTATVTVPAYADGGYVDRPTLAIVGEAGPEHIVPAGQMGRGVSPVINLTFSYTSGGGGEAEADRIERAVESGIRAGFERLQLQSGRRF